MSPVFPVRRSLCVLSSFASFLSCVLLASLPALAAQGPQCPKNDSEMVIKAGEFSPSPGVVFGLQDFSAKMRSQSPRAPLCFQRFTDVQHGHVVVSSSSLTHVFEQKMQKKADSKVSDVKIEVKDDAISITGKVKKLITMPFTVEGPLSTDGKVLRVDAKTIKAAGIPVKGLLQMVGEQLASLMGAESVKGVQVQGNAILFAPEMLARIRGHIQSAKATAQGLVVDFGAMQKNAPAVAANRSVNNGVTHGVTSVRGVAAAVPSVHR